MRLQVVHTASRDRWIENAGSQSYLCVQSDGNNCTRELATKVLTDINDPEVDFILHYYTSANGKMVVFEHNGWFVSVSDDELALLARDEVYDDCDISEVTDPSRITKSECFFYIESTGFGEDRYVFKTSDGTLYWSINDDGDKVILKTFCGRRYPSAMEFG